MLLSTAFASPLQAQDQVDRAIEDLVRQHYPPGSELQVERLASRASFPTCQSPAAFLPRTAADKPLGRTTVGLRCRGQADRYLPVQISLIGDFYRLAKAVPAGSVIGESLLERSRGDLSKLPPQAILELEQIEGQVATHALSPGTILQEYHLRRPALISRGEQVTVESRGRGFVVSRKGEALQRGSLGDRIRVRLSRRQILDAEVIANGRVRPLGQGS